MTLKTIIKNITGGEDLNLRQRAICLWAAISFLGVFVCASSLLLECIAIVSFIVSIKYINQVPLPEEYK